MTSTFEPPRIRSDQARPTRRVASLVAAIVLGVAVAACGGAASPEIPTGLPTSLPSSLPTDLTGGTTACIDAATMDLLSQMQAPDADIEAILAANKDQLISGLEAFEAPDQVTGSWRDDLVAALEAGDMATAADQVTAITTAGITLSAC
jgi:hypothetical protein